ncbi:hypothetical protein ABIC24_000583 [Methylobacterium radiotolerans]
MPFGVDALVDEAGHTPDEGPRLPRARACLKEIGAAAVRHGDVLAGVAPERTAGGDGDRVWDRRKQQGIEQLLGDDVFRDAEAGGDVRDAHALRVTIARDRSWQHQFAGEEVGLDLPTLASPIVDELLDGGAALRRAAGIGVVGEDRVRAAVHRHMAELVPDQQGVATRRASLAVQDPLRVGIDARFASMQRHVAGLHRLMPQVVRGDGTYDDVERLPGITAVGDDLPVDACSSFPRGLNRIHVRPLPC